MSHADLQRRRDASVVRAAASIHPIYPAEAKGSYVWDGEGNRYLDFSVGIAVMNVGHSHPKVIEAVTKQASSFQHLCFAVGMHESYVELAERLNALMPGDGPSRAFFANSGAEAVENAVKIARVATGRPGIVAFTHAFHGRTHMALSLTAKANPYKAPFAPRAAEIYRADYPYCYRCPFGGPDADGGCCQHDANRLRDQVASFIGEDQVAAFLVEPVAGEGGFIPAPASFLRAVRAYADEIGALWIDDEVQSGIGRTGAWWAVDHDGLAPDLLTSAKALSSGFPLAAVVGRADVMDAPGPGHLGSTFGGNPVSIAAALATLDVIEEEDLLTRATHIGARFTSMLQDLQRAFPRIGDVRGVGAMIGIEFVADDAKTPDKGAVEAVVRHAREDGLLLLPTGTYGNVIRLLPPLNLSDAEIEEGLQKLEGAVRKALA
jgi:4-aminobutyrate aminotransferase/(S)-3-amino-2-methylpropionate transaminase